MRKKLIEVTPLFFFVACGSPNQTSLHSVELDRAQRTVHQFIEADTTADWNAAIQLLWRADNLGNPFCETATDHVKVVAGVALVGTQSVTDTARVDVEYRNIGYAFSVGVDDTGEGLWRFVSNVGVDTVRFNVIADEEKRLFIACDGPKPNHLPYAYVHSHYLPWVNDESNADWEEAERLARSLSWNVPDN